MKNGKKSLPRLIAVWCLLCGILLTSLAACHPKGSDPEESGSDDGTKPAEGLLLIENCTSDYVIVRSESADSRVVEAAKKLREKIREATGVNLRINNDLDAQSGYEILVGETNRAAGKSVLEGLSYNDYTVAVSGNSLILAGGNPVKTAEAVDRFIQDYLHTPVQSLFFPASAVILERINYEIGQVMLCGADLRDYSVVRSANAVYAELSEVNSLCRLVQERFGIDLYVKKDSEPEREREIVVGTAKPGWSQTLTSALNGCAEADGLIFFEDGKVYLTGKTTAGVRNAMRVFRQEYLGAQAAGTLTVSTQNRVCPNNGREYRVMSFNILCYVKEDQDRINAVISKIRGQSPDLLGVQECSLDWYEELCDALGGEYGVVGELNSPKGQRWRNAVFYRKDRFRLIETKTQWLSPTPDTVSKLPASSQYRVLTYAVLEDLETGARITHCNTHMDYVEDARPAQFNILVQLLSQLDTPLLLTGDFNIFDSSPYYAQIQNAGYRSAFEMTSDHDTSPSYMTSGTIDFCFVTPGQINVIEHDVLDQYENGVEASDHHAVVVRFTLFS